MIGWGYLVVALVTAVLGGGGITAYFASKDNLTAKEDENDVTEKELYISASNTIIQALRDEIERLNRKQISMESKIDKLEKTNEEEMKRLRNLYEKDLDFYRKEVAQLKSENNILRIEVNKKDLIIDSYRIKLKVFEKEI